MRYLLFILFILLSEAIYGQDTYITGQATLKGSSIAISDVYIYIEELTIGDLTDANGAYHIGPITPGSYTVILTSLAYRDIVKEVTVQPNQSSTQLDFYLLESVNALPTIEINSNATTGGLLGNLSAPGSQHYISGTTIAEIQTTNPNAILQRIPGVQIQEEDGFGLRPNIGLRGSGSERSSKITIMEDGIPLAPAPYSAPSAYFFPTMARMSGVAVMKGSSQIVHGPYTTGGVINMLSTPIPDRLKGKVTLGAGSFGGRNIHAHVGDRVGQFSYLLETFQYSAEGFKEIDFTDQNTGFDKKDYLAKIRWSSSNEANIQQFIELKVGESRELSNETYLGLTYEDFTNSPYRRYAGSQVDEMNTAHQQLSVKHFISPLEHLHIQTTAYQNTFDRNWYKVDDVVINDDNSISINNILSNTQEYSTAYNYLIGQQAMDDASLIVKANNRAYLSKGIMSRINYEFDNHSFEGGFRLHYDEMDRFQWEDTYRLIDQSMKLVETGVRGTESNRIESATAIATYIQHKWSMDKWTITTGLRNERIEMGREDYGKADPGREGSNLTSRRNSTSTWIPGISVQYVLQHNHELFAGLHRGFAPQGSNPDTDPELSLNYEAGYRIQTNQLYGNITAFYNDYQNLLGADFASSGGVGTGDAFNGGAAKAFGIEIAMDYRYKLNKTVWIPIQLQYTYTNATFNSNFDSAFDPWGNVSVGDGIPYIADHSLTMSSGLRHQRFSINVTGNYVGGMRIEAGQSTLMDGNHIPARFLLSGNVAYHLRHNVTFRLGGHNLLDNVYAVAARPAGWRPGAPRNITCTAEVWF